MVNGKHRINGFDPSSIQAPSDHITVSPHLVENSSKQELSSFITKYHSQTNHPTQKALRDNARSAVLNTIECAEVPTHTVKLAIFDLDHTGVLLYPISSTTGAWSIRRLADMHHLDVDALYTATRDVPAEYLCHDPRGFINFLAREAKIPALKSDNPANKSIMEDWLEARRILTMHGTFQAFKNIVPKIKQAGGLVAIATNGPEDSVVERLFWLFGNSGFHHFDVIAPCAPLPGMTRSHELADRGIPAFHQRLSGSGKIITMPCDGLKPDGNHLMVILNHVNDCLGSWGAPKITPREVVMIGDSLSSDGGAAQDVARFTGGVPTQFVYTAQGIVVDPSVLKAHALVGSSKDVLGVEPVLARLKKGNYTRPNMAVASLDALTQYNWSPALRPEGGRYPSLHHRGGRGSDSLSLVIA